jgi:hypothetical protein
MLRTLRGHSNSVLAVQFDSRIIVSGSEDHTVRVWSSTEGQLYVKVVQTGTCGLLLATGFGPTAPSLLCDEVDRESFRFSQRTSYQYRVHQRRQGAIIPKFPTVSHTACIHWRATRRRLHACTWTTHTLSLAPATGVCRLESDRRVRCFFWCFIWVSGA